MFPYVCTAGAQSVDPWLSCQTSNANKTQENIVYVEKQGLHTRYMSAELIRIAENDT